MGKKKTLQIEYWVHHANPYEVELAIGTIGRGATERSALEDALCKEFRQYAKHEKPGVLSSRLSAITCEGLPF